MNKEKIWCADGVSTNNTTRMSNTFVCDCIEISVLNVTIGVILMKYNTMCHTLRGSWHIRATNLYIKYGCMKDSVLLGYDAVSLSNRLATFGGNVTSSTWSVKTSRNVRVSWTLWSFMMHNTLPRSFGIWSLSAAASYFRNEPPVPHAAKPSKPAWLYEVHTCWWRFANYTNVSSTAGIKRKSTCVQSMKDFMLS